MDLTTLDPYETQWYKDNERSMLYVGYRGSIAHGTYIPSTDPNSIDDVDTMGVYFGTLSHYFGFSGRDVVEKVEGPWDVVLYEFRKFISLLEKQNPNVLGLLWTPEECTILDTSAWDNLVENRSKFLSKEIFNTFSGYAYSQLKKMENNATQGYMGDKRKQLVEKHGYDTKNAAHLVRLLRMGIEALDTGELNVRRTHDVQELIDIKTGRFTLEEVKEKAETLFRTLEQSKLSSKLPERTDRVFINDLQVEILSGHFSIYPPETEADRKMDSGIVEHS